MILRPVAFSAMRGGTGSGVHQRSNAKMCLVVLLLAIASTVLTACGGSGALSPIRSEHVSKDAQSGPWPFSAAGGTVTCDLTKGGAITFTPDGSRTTYAINGPAVGRQSDEGWHPIKEIWLDDPTLPGAKINDGYFITEGQKLCEAASPTPSP